MEPVFVLGGYQTDFARNWTRESVGDPLLSMLRESALGALETTKVAPEEVDSVHVSNFASEAFTGQSHLGAFIPMLDSAWSEIPTSRHEAACASGSVALLSAAAEIESGRYDLVLVVGAELMRNIPGREAARRIGSATWVGHEGFGGALPWPSQFDLISEEVEARYGLDRAHLSRISEINQANARRNPLAQTRDWDGNPARFSQDDEANPIVAGRTRGSDCGRISDGATAVLLAGRGFMERRDERATSVVSGWGHRTAAIPLAAKLEASRGADYLFPHVRRTITDAYARAGVVAEEIDVFEVHDCFTVNEYLAIEHLGITAPGHAWKAVEDGWIEDGGSSPVNPSGGLIGAGHPVGATGVRMLLDAHRQVTGTAGGYQVAGARTAGTLNIGGSCSTAASFVVRSQA